MVGCRLPLSADELASNYFARTAHARQDLHRAHRWIDAGDWPEVSCSTALYCTRDAKEGDTSFEEGGDGNLVGGVEGNAGFATGFGGFVGEAEAGKSGEVGLREVQLAESVARSKVSDSFSVTATRSG